MNRLPGAVRAALLGLGGFSLLIGLDAGLSLGGLGFPGFAASWADQHGALMVFGFLGTLIALERSVALRRPWAIWPPALIGAGALISAALSDLLPAGPLLGRLLMAEGFALFVAVYAALWRRNRDAATAVQALGAVAAFCAVSLMHRMTWSALLPLAITFIVLTIAAERVELARIAMPKSATRSLVAWSCLLIAAAQTALLWPIAGWPLLGAALLPFTAWLAVHDVARRTVRSSGLARFSAVAILSGYGWLSASAVLMLSGEPDGGYEALVHMVFLGFAMSMVFAHAPIILPATIGVRLPYRSAMWLPLAVLHLGLAARVLGATPALSDSPLSDAGRIATVIALLLFVLTNAASALLAPRSPKQVAQNR